MKRIVIMSMALVVLFGLADVGFAADLKKIVVLDMQNLNPIIFDQMLDGLTQAGLIDQQNVRIEKIIVPSQGDLAQVVAQIKESAPAAILDVSGLNDTLVALKGLSIPVITRINVEPFVGADGMPTANITGIYTTLQDRD